ncbi:beta-ketoacyl-ACP synthase III [Candidatus Finniella inopinata]|uniref:Beta-ketoacyl-[acyl-carrier-protein] synthase III n=1 Tax=Candidatus Finniella inopinata TaxID=1696036 RepID=A0A4Q7DF73_9PROT|nr:beta-ketoacyl-ACP synthase III [Candidatus Finniella inopinata]RZI45343.1 ketoacyl-ACP synthase III [Candidatus Finniella inopinata]
MLNISTIIGTGSCLPKRIVTNHELAARLDTTDEWIRERSGISQRHIAADDEKTSDLATQAARQALERAGLTGDQLDCIVVATTTPDNSFPATATRVQANLGATKAFAFDVQAVCSGFVYALTVADNFIRLGQVKNALVIGAETMSRLLDWQDRGTCFLFGDGAGAVVLQAQPDSGDKQGILSTHLFSDGRHYDWLYTDHSFGGPQTRGTIHMQGREIFKSAVDKIGQAVEKALDHNNLKASDIDWFVPHQANVRIIKGVCERFSIPQEKMVVTIAEHANTSAASIPLALEKAVSDGRIQKGHLVLIEAMGGGLTWGSALIRW